MNHDYLKYVYGKVKYLVGEYASYMSDHGLEKHYRSPLVFIEENSGRTSGEKVINEYIQLREQKKQLVVEIIGKDKRPILYDVSVFAIQFDGGRVVPFIGDIPTAWMKMLNEK